MPNHVINVLTFNGPKESIRELFRMVRRDGDVWGSIDFQRLLPIPEDLNISSGSRGRKGQLVYRKFKDATKELTEEEKEILWESYVKKYGETLKLGKQYEENTEKYGAPTWHEWCLQNWGTKWNAYDCLEMGRDAKRMVFTTAWNPPDGIVKAMSLRFPTIKIRHQWSDENLGWNTGEFLWKNGKVLEAHLYKAESEEAMILSCELWNVKTKDLTPEGESLKLDG